MRLRARGSSLPAYRETWRPPERPVCSQSCYWQFDRFSVWLKSLLLLDAGMARDISVLGVFDEWVISGSPQAAVICDHGGSRWEDYRPWYFHPMPLRPAASLQ
ncbi:hypothetical protein [Pantoea agglomerans]|uniref:hypothetical protein n=1 Tax=Enterobacter agglomerans TaxID=549 RepID=UPI00320B8AB2